MPIERKQWPKITTPKGVAVFPRINVPDTKFKAEGEYSVKLRLTGTDAAALAKRVTEFRDEAYKVELADKKAKKLKLADLPFKQASTRDGEEIADTFDFTCKRKASGTTKSGKSWERTVAIFDAKGTPIKDDVWGGSVIRCNVVLSPWFVAALGFGVKLELQAVQVIELVTSGGERTASEYGFGEEDGYTAAPEAPAGAPEADAPAGEGDGTEGLGDFN